MRRRKVKEMLYGWLGLEEGRTLRPTYELTWRGDTREIEIIYKNIRKTALPKLKSDGDTWLLVLDYPFDEEEGFFPSDDVAKLDDFEEQYGEGTETVAWLPTFLSSEGRRLLGRLVQIDTVLDRFDEYAGGLREKNREMARRQLENN
ncbi:MAG: phage resistance protein, partial [Bradymonadaceae bacterium]